MGHNAGSGPPLRADLHSHSSVSDGTTPPADVMARAAAAGLNVIALTDHDTVAGHPEAAAALPRGLTLLPGMELSCRLSGHSVHVLAYLFDPRDPELAGELAVIRDSRVSRAQEMVRRLGELGVPVTWDQVQAIAGSGVVGRPHIARALAAAGVVATPADAFSPEWIGPGGRVYVTRYALDPIRAVTLIGAAGGVSVLAHPRGYGRGWQIPDDVIGELAGGRADRDRGQPPAAGRGGPGRAERPGRIAGPGSLGRQRRPRRADRIPDRDRNRPAGQLPAADRAGHRRRAGHGRRRLAGLAPRRRGPDYRLARNYRRAHS